MRRRRIRITCNQMCQTLRRLQSHKPYFSQVCSLFSLFSYLPSKAFHFNSSFEEPEPPLSSSTHNTNDTHIDLSSIVSKSIILRSSHLLEKKGETFVKPSLKDLLLKLSDISPEIIRRFWRVSELKPEDVHEILLGFQFDCGKLEIESKKIEFLWGIFKWARDQTRDFKHLPLSCELMASMLVRGGLFREVEFLLSTMDKEGILLDSNEVFSDLIKGFVGAGDIKRAISIYDRMRGKGLVLSSSCYHVILEFLIQMNETQLAFQVYVDMVEMGLGVSNEEIYIFENVIGLLCRDGKVQQARNLVKKVITFGMEPTKLVLDEIAHGYSEKKDYDDLLSFFVDMKCAPNVTVGNKVIFDLCKNFGTERTILFLHELEHLGFDPDEITFGIIIGWSCNEGKVKDAFICLSEVLSRRLKPDVRSYNALIGAVFKEGMWKLAQDILRELDDMGIKPNMSTFKVLLAGYCIAREFEEVNMMIGEMVNRGLIQLSSLEDPLTKAFTVLGLGPMDVKVKRDNDLVFSRTEFYDKLGNGLYLDTDLDEYESTLTEVLQDSLIPDFNLLITQECGVGNLKTAMGMVDEMVRWGQELSLSSFSLLVKGFNESRCCIKAIINLLDKMPKLSNQLDQETLDVLVQALMKGGFTHKSRIIFGQMVQRQLKIKNDTYNALIMGLCKARSLTDFLDCWEYAKTDKWLPELKDFETLIGYLCRKKFLKEASELFVSTVEAYPHKRLDVFHTFLEKLCGTGFTGISHVLLDEFQRHGYVLDHIAYSHLIRGFCKEKRFSKAFSVLDYMLANNLVPSLDLSVLLIPPLCSRGKFDKAVASKEIGMRDQSFYNMLVVGHCRAKNLSKAREILGVMIRNNIGISISSYRSLLRLTCIEGKVPFALSMKELMLKENNPTSLIIHNILIFSLFLIGDSLRVDRLLDELQEKGLELDEVTYNFLVFGYSKCKIMSRSIQHLNTMMLKELRPNNRALRTVICCLCSDGGLEKALDLSREMASRGWDHGSMIQNAIVEGLLGQGKSEAAINFLDRMVEKGLIPDFINYDNLIKKLSWYGQQGKAVDLLNIMLKKGNIPNSSSYDTIIQGFCTNREFDRALDFHAEMLARNLRPSIQTLNLLIRNFCQDGRTVDAEKLMKCMIQMGETPTREMYCSVINRYRLEKNMDKASMLLQEMQRNGYEPDFETHWSLISNLSNSSEKEKSSIGRPFLSRLLSESGFAQRKDH